jgi:hypothetical protein
MTRPGPTPRKYAPPVNDPGTPIADELEHGPSAYRYRPQPEDLLPPVLAAQTDGEQRRTAPREETTAMPAAATPDPAPLFDPDIPEDEPFSAQLARARSRPRSSTRPEGEITAECLDWLNAQPRTKARKVHQSAMTGGGEPDIDACSRGRAVKIEMKRPGEEPPERQLRRMWEWQRAGALVGWATSLQEVQALMAHVHDLEWINPLTGPGAPVAPPG